MHLTRLMMAVALTSMAATPVLAANPAASLSVSAARASAPAGKRTLAGGNSGVLMVLAVVAVLAFATSVGGNGDNNSSSP